MPGHTTVTRIVAPCVLFAIVAVMPIRADDQFVAEREAMVNELVAAGIISDEAVIEAMKTVPRHRFVPSGQVGSAYQDRPLPIGQEQTISAPGIVGMMTEALKLQETDRVLEIGTGSGYQAAVAAEIVRHVYSIEIIEALAVSARQRLAELGYENITVRHGDGYEGWPEHAPFDAIIVTAAPESVPQPLIDQLKEGGRMVIPVAEAGWAQTLYLIEKRDGQLHRTELTDVIFVPMTREER